MEVLSQHLLPNDVMFREGRDFQLTRVELQSDGPVRVDGRAIGDDNDVQRWTYAYGELCRIRDTQSGRRI